MLKNSNYNNTKKTEKGRVNVVHLFNQITVLYWSFVPQIISETTCLYTST